MKYVVEYSVAAIRDLDRVWEEVFGVSKSYDITSKYIDDLMDKVEERADFPKSGSPLYYENKFTESDKKISQQEQKNKRRSNSGKRLFF